MVAIEISYFIYYKMNETWLNSYMRQILNSDMIWAHDKKDEIHRWFTYTFIHSSTSHITTNVILQVRLQSLSTDQVLVRETLASDMDPKTPDIFRKLS